MCAARSVGSGDSCVVDATTALMMCVTAQGESGFGGADGEKRT